MRIKKPRAYQKRGVKIISDGLLKGDRGWICADETGLGKSGQGLLIAEKIMKVSKHNKVIILCPAFLKGKWVDEIHEWIPDKRPWSIIIKSYSEIIDGDMLRYLTKYKYGLMIIDELHYLKEFTSMRTLAAFGEPGCQYKPLVKCSKHLLGLTATPLPQGRVGEMYPWLWATKDPALKGLTYENFVKKWADTWRETSFGLTHKGLSNPAAFRKIVQKRMIRRKKLDVLKDLPPGTRTIIPLTYSAKAYKEEQKLLKELLKKSGYHGASLNALLFNPDMLQTMADKMPSFDQMSIFKKQQGLLKIKYVFDHLVESVLPEDRKIAVLSYHKDVAQSYFDKIQKHFKKNKIKTPMTLITGDVPVADRLAILKKADEDKEHILVATMHSIKEGFDLIGFRTIFFTELDWTPGVLDQVEGRFMRFGQKFPVFWNYFVFEKGIERYIFDLLKEKNETISKLLR